MMATAGARTRLAALGALAGVGALVACHRAPDAAARGAAADASVGGDAAVGAIASAPAVVAARCHSTGRAFVIGDGRALDELEIGDALATPDGTAVGIVHRAAAGRVASVAMLATGASEVRLVDLGPTLGDAPPPRLAWRGKDVVAGAFGLSTDAREVVVHAVGASARLLFSVPEQRDDSLSFDLAYAGSGGLIVWDEATAGRAPRGVIRAAAFAGDQRTDPTRDVSPADSDAEAPRVVPADGGFFVVWIARRPEPAASDAAVVEVVGEPRAYAWLESVMVDAHGAATGPVRRLTPDTGHVSAYDVQALPEGGKPTLLVAARDDGESVDGSGGALLRVRVRDDGADPPLTFPSDGLGRGAPTFVDAPAGSGSPGPWLTWIGPKEQLRLLPLDASGAPLAPPSAEEALDEARPLLLLARGNAPDGPVSALIATPSDPAAQLRVFACGR